MTKFAKGTTIERIDEKLHRVCSPKGAICHYCHSSQEAQDFAQIYETYA